MTVVSAGEAARGARSRLRGASGSAAGGGRSAGAPR
jgi:hypothetical protein